jgi:hypothetical protein
MAVEFHIVAVHEDWRAGGLLNFAQAANVVNMRVRAHNGFYRERMLCQNFEYSGGFISRIHHERFARFGIADNRAIALQHADRQDFVNDLLWCGTWNSH